MIRVATTRADFALCAEINNAVNPDRPVTVEQIATAPGSCSFARRRLRVRDRVEHPGERVRRMYVCDPSRADEASAARCSQPHARTLAGARLRVASGAESAKAMTRLALHGATRGFEEVNRDVDVLLEIAPGDGEAPGIVELRGAPARARTRSRPSAFRRWRCLSTPKRNRSTSGSREEERNSPVAFVALDGEEVVGYARLYALSALPAAARERAHGSRSAATDAAASRPR